MNRTRPVRFYEERLKDIDEDICIMISKPLEYIAKSIL